MFPFLQSHFFSCYQVLGIPERFDPGPQMEPRMWDQGHLKWDPGAKIMQVGPGPGIQTPKIFKRDPEPLILFHLEKY